MAHALFIIDFDLTISREHIHNKLFNAIYQGLIGADDLEAQWNYIKDVQTRGTSEQWKNLFATLIQDGHDVAIASFSEHKPIVQRYLREKIGLSNSLYNKIFIESWLPKNSYHADKNQHIQNVIQHFHYKNDPAFIVLIDDSTPNLIAARKKNYTTIEVLPDDVDGKFINDVLKLSAQWK